VNNVCFFGIFLIILKTNPIIRAMNILMLNDNEDSTWGYEQELKYRNHNLFVTETPEDCLRLYQSKLQEIFFKTDPVEHIQPFDAVIIDCESCGVGEMEIAKEILALNSRQRILLIVTSKVYQFIAMSSEGVKTTLAILRKPISIHSIVDTVELKSVYLELQRRHVDTNIIRRANFRHEQIVSILDIMTNSKAAYFG
jgi:response regulator RpfG family c-di-GMP phosphodiesterase